MRRLIFTALLLSLLSTLPEPAQASGPVRRALRGASAVVAAPVKAVRARAHARQARGQWTLFGRVCGCG